LRLEAAARIDAFQQQNPRRTGDVPRRDTTLRSRRVCSGFTLQQSLTRTSFWQHVRGAIAPFAHEGTMVIAVLQPPSRPTSAPARLGRTLGRLALFAGVLCALAAALAGPAYRVEVLPLGIALQSVRWAGTIAVGGAAVALLAVLLTAGAGARSRWRRRARWALVLNIAVAAGPLYMLYLLQTQPQLHDISTDGVNPPAFEAVVPLRRGASNPIDYDPATAAQQRQGYPDIAPLELALTPAVAFDNAERAARAMGWQIVQTAPDKLRLEAIDTSLLFGFKDDVVVRVTPKGSGSVVDVRSLSRVGGSDFGANARRVRAYLKRVATASGAA
jgi:uncharacterized protein (DUF1499 family)/uncharacterized membrane protein YgdD (TMEM256/DUF423 family)